MEFELNENGCKTLLYKLGQYSSVDQKTLLDSIEQYAENGAEKPTSDGSNGFYIIFHKSGLQNKIMELLYKESLKDNTQIMNQEYYSLAIQLVRVILYMKKGQQIRKYLQRICAKITFESISTLLVKLKKSNENRENIIDEELEIQIKQGTKLLLSISCVDRLNLDYFLRKDNISEQIYYLTHILCPNELNCQHQLILPITSTTINFKEAIFKASFHLSQNTYQKENNSIKQVIIHHQAQFVINLQREIIEIKKNNNVTVNSLSLISSFYKTLIHTITQYYQHINQEQLCEDISTIPGLIPSLTDFIKYIVNKKADDELIIQLTDIQLLILKMLYLLHLKCSNETLNHLVCQSKCLNVFDCIIVVDKRSCNNNINNICRALQSIHIISQKIDGRYFSVQQYELRKSIEEQFEEKGSIEEIEANFFISGETLWKIRYPSKEIKNSMINVEKDQLNKIQ